MSTAKISDLSGAALPLTGDELMELSQLSGGTYGSVQGASRYVGYADRQYGTFHDLTNQTGNIAAATAITFNTPIINTHGVTIVSGSQLTFSKAGDYFVTLGLQFANSDTANHNVNVWLAKNGVAIVGSNLIANVPKASDGGAAYRELCDLITLAAGDYIQAFWLPTSATVTLATTAAGAIAPSTPSARLSAERVGL